ncbi:MAG TPA: M20/M25/M40 family metallo-hydrolase [Bryobacteraceae bacterium]|nr:M20/M25/M40 family metallo-hydrolase [Bryobacteraceae bacterium]
MRLALASFAVCGIWIAATGCSKTTSTAAAGTIPSGTATHKYRPDGDTKVHIDMTQIKNEELKKVFSYIDDHFDEHVERLQKWIRQPSISNSGEGIPESAEMVKGFFDELGCQQSRVYDTGVTEWGLPGNPVVYAKCDEGAPKTVAIYWQYDTMPVTQPENWKVPPFDAAIIPQGEFKKVLVARGATNSKGPEMTQYNALMSIKKVRGKLPVNIIFVAEGDEERMDIGLRNFVRDHPDLLKGADTMLGMGSSEGCVYVQLTTSGKSWGRGPVESDIHGSNKRSVDSPAWRHIKMLASLVSDDGNTPLIQGWNENKVAPTKEQLDRLHKRTENADIKTMEENLGVARYIADNPFDVMRMQTYETSFNLDGIWGGNMYADAAGAILPNKITSKHNIRYVPNMNGMDLVKKIRAQLDRNGYKDVEMKVIGDVPWSISDPDNDINHAATKMYAAFGVTSRRMMAANHQPTDAETGGYWPSYLFNNGKVGQKVSPVGMPIGGGAVGIGGRAHAANEFYVIEGSGNTYGMAGAEKSIATVLYNYAGLN